MEVVFSIKERGKRPQLQTGDYFVDHGKMIIGVVLAERDWGIMRLLFENKIVSREQIGDRFFPNVSKDTVNRRLRKLIDVNLIRRTTEYIGRKAISGYSLTQSGLAKITPMLPYEVKTKATRSKCPLHEIALNDIRQVFESKRTVQGYYTKNVLQTRTDFTNNEWFEPFIKLNSDAMVEVDSKVGTLHLAIEFDTAHKSPRSYRRKLNAYYGQPNVDGVLYVCADERILQTLLKLDREATKRHTCYPKLYFSLLDDVTESESKMTFTNANRNIFYVH